MRKPFHGSRKDQLADWRIDGRVLRIMHTMQNRVVTFGLNGKCDRFFVVTLCDVAMGIPDLTRRVSVR